MNPKSVLIVPVVVLAACAGAAVVGRPATVPHDIVFSEIPPSTSTAVPTTTARPEPLAPDVETSASTDAAGATAEIDETVATERTDDP